MASRHSQLEAAYRQAVYRVCLGQTAIDWQIGRIDADADRRLQQAAGDLCRWAFVTACNPYSRQLDQAGNRQRQDRLRQRLQALGQRWRPALHCDPAAQWPDEESFFLLDPPPGRAETLGRAFAQNAVVTGAPGKAPVLLWLRPRRGGKTLIE